MKRTIMMATLVLSMGTVSAEAGTILKIKKNAPKILKGSLRDVVSADTLEDAGKAVAKETLAVTVVAPALTSAAISTAGAMGATASTGTAIASLSGAAATSATLAYIGTGVAGAVGMTVASPAIVGGMIVAGVSSAVVFSVDWLLDDE